MTTDTESVLKRFAAPPAERDRAATLLLADGTIVVGRGAGSRATMSGELVFTTAMTGYEEALTDPSYRGQILVFTYPLVGNYGVAPERMQSGRIHVAGVVMSTLTEPANGVRSLDSWLQEAGIPAIHGVDTRALAQRIRAEGSTPAALAVYGTDERVPMATLHRKVRECRYDDVDFVSDVTLSAPEIHGRGGRTLLALLDCGNKRSVVRELVRRDAEVACLPAATPAADILALRPDGLVLSNGPGNPGSAGPVVETVHELMGQIPMFGICLGHQILALASGARTHRLPFGHRGANHPVQDLRSGRAFITTQNHGFAVDESSLPPTLAVSHRNLNDGTVEGLSHRTLPIRSVQFHPEGAPGPTDSGVVLDEWLRSIA